MAGRVQNYTSLVDAIAFFSRERFRIPRGQLGLGLGFVPVFIYEKLYEIVQQKGRYSRYPKTLSGEKM